MKEKTMPRFAGDPRWIGHIRKPGRCAGCGCALAVGARAFYYPVDNSLYCGREACGPRHAREFAAAAFDDEMLGGGHL